MPNPRVQYDTRSATEPHHPPTQCAGKVIDVAVKGTIIEILILVHRKESFCCVRSSVVSIDGKERYFLLAYVAKTMCIRIFSGN